MNAKHPQIILEEKLNTYSHGLGIILAVLGAYFIINSSEIHFKFGLTIYCLSLILLFTASTLYHAVTNPFKKQQLRILDHISIYYLIAGTYTPVCLYILEDSNGIPLLYLVWGIAIFGTILKLFFTGQFEVFSLVLYGIMGWLIVLDLSYLMEHISSQGLFFLGLGGAFYTIGILFYALRRIPYNHFIWHLFVLGGAISHWLLINNELSN
ncbi:PAQR family membrane homeostasis protein TrhA [Croceitalea rosinachiae]|uniref:Hemolysin III family protein n=1 Tax=Croceitalea rosinachiae TaxID=3075596 RepID=A0ABU3AEI1_9FLAO|nr:hemolysin III family protein [Croceitalea sp. F388]MDT0608592.1 hemolysin III family protein [Croceitalea sp. F388]